MYVLTFMYHLKDKVSSRPIQNRKFNMHLKLFYSIVVPHWDFVNSSNQYAIYHVCHAGFQMMFLSPFLRPSSDKVFYFSAFLSPCTFFQMCIYTHFYTNSNTFYRYVPTFYNINFGFGFKMIPKHLWFYMSAYIIISTCHVKLQN